MSAPRLATISFEHIEAEMAVFPLVSEASFKRAITSLNPIVVRDDVLWRAAERELIGAIPSFPLDEATAIRDQLWFDNSALAEDRTDKYDSLYNTISLVSYLRRLANRYLDAQGHPIVTATESDAGEYPGPEGRLRWSWMCQAFPPDLLRVARGLRDPDANPFPLNSTIDSILRDGGFAETHLHLGAGVDFSLTWAALMAGLATTESNHSDFESPGASFDDGRGLCTWIMYIAVARLVLAESLSHGSSKIPFERLLDFLRRRPDVQFDAVECNRLATILSELRNGCWQHSRRQMFSASRRDLFTKRFAQSRAIYRKLIRRVGTRYGETTKSSWQLFQAPKTRLDVFEKDPMALVLNWRRTEGVTPDTVFLDAALRRIEEDERNGEKDTDFARLFWQIVRIRCLLYRHIVQRPLTPGLQWFVRFFSRIKPLRKNLSNSVLTSSAAKITGEGTGLRSFEVRLGTDESESACLDLVRSLEQVALPQSEAKTFRFFRPGKDHKEKRNAENCSPAKFEVGGVFHFSRKRGGGWEIGKPNASGLDHSFPGFARPIGSKPLKDTGNPTGFRFARFYMQQRRHAQALVSLFQKYPLALRTVRGVDLCTDESGVPIWVMAPLIQWVRDAGQQAVLHLKRRGEVEIPPLRTTVHAGEDFVHLMAGLRRIDNTITYLNLREGDRLGHALALGIDASAWCVSAGRVVQTREERLFDLMWEWGCYANHNVDVTSKRLAFVRTEIVRLARQIFQIDTERSFSPEDLTMFWRLLHRQRALLDAGFPNQPRRQPDRNQDEDSKNTPQRLLNSYLSNKEVWRKGRVLENIDLRALKHESGALEELQRGLRQRIGKLGLTIEVNPSSNLLIGDLIDFRNHPLWRIKPVNGSKKTSPLSICIGSDNPLTFATTLPHEYQLLFDAMVLGDESNEVAIKWIDEVRESGLRARFTLSPEIARLSQELTVLNLMRLERPASPP